MNTKTVNTSGDLYVLTIPDVAGNDQLGFADVAKGIICESWHIGAQLPMQLDMANSERTAGRVQVSDMMIRKMSDLSTCKLWQACTAAMSFAEVRLRVGRTGASDYSPLMEWVMTNAMISSIRTIGSGEGGLPIDEFNISFTSIEMTYSQQGLDAAVLGGNAFNWDLATNGPLS